MLTLIAVVGVVNLVLAALLAWKRHREVCAWRAARQAWREECGDG